MIKSTPISIDDLSKIKWRCRRGMLELDLMLNSFFERCYSELSKEEKVTFTNLLAIEDPTLFAWLLGHEEVNEQAFQSIVAMIRAHNK